MTKSLLSITLLYDTLGHSKYETAIIFIYIQYTCANFVLAQAQVFTHLLNTVNSFAMSNIRQGTRKSAPTVDALINSREVPKMNPEQ